MSVQYYGPQAVTKALFNQQLIDNPPPVISIDTETISLKEKLPILFAIATAPNEAWCFDILPERDLEIALLQSLMTNPAIRKAYANVMFDVKVEIGNDNIAAKDENSTDSDHADHSQLFFPDLNRTSTHNRHDFGIGPYVVKNNVANDLEVVSRL